MKKGSKKKIKNYFYKIQYAKNKKDSYHTASLSRYGVSRKNKFSSKLKANVWFLRQGNRINVRNVYAVRIKKFYK